ncbi:MAG: hypothetical protein K0U39_07055 [Alphaproteobacteria bacterium]|nr:hypothetical protein [Alphaproteobacteria bacterium]
MEDLKKLIDENSENYPELEELEVQIYFAQGNATEYPDTAIESCKALLESTCKFIIIQFDGEYVPETDDKKMNFNDVVQKALGHLESKSPIFERGFISQCIKFAKQIGKFRNELGDISHGKCPPKQKKATPELVKTTIKMTEAVAEALLGEFLAIKQGRTSQINQRIKPLLTEQRAMIYENEQNEDDEGEIIKDYHQWLDDITPMQGVLRYSRALYDQDYDVYVEQYDEWYYKK